MLRRYLVLLPLSLALLAGCGNGGAGEGTTLENAQGVTRQIAGRWRGELHQKGLLPFEIGVDISADGHGRVAYTGIECGGDWTLRGVQQTLPPNYVFTEKIDAGAGGSCKGTGTVTLAPIQRHAPNEPAYSRLNYVFEGGGVSSRGLLRRTDASNLDQAFEGAGIAPPV